MDEKFFLIMAFVLSMIAGLVVAKSENITLSENKQIIHMVEYKEVEEWSQK